MQTVVNQEKGICRMLNRKEPSALKTLAEMFIFFEYDDHLRPTVHPALINAIYVAQIEEERWKLTNLANISSSTSYRYRHLYIDYFYLRYNAAEAKANSALASAG